MIVAPTIPEIKFYLTLKINFTSNQSYCHSVFAIIFIVCVEWGDLSESYYGGDFEDFKILLQKGMIFYSSKF